MVFLTLNHTRDVFKEENDSKILLARRFFLIFFKFNLKNEVPDKL